MIMVSHKYNDTHVHISYIFVLVHEYNNNITSDNCREVNLLAYYGKQLDNNKKPKYVNTTFVKEGQTTSPEINYYYYYYHYY